MHQHCQAGIVFSIGDLHSVAIKKLGLNVNCAEHLYYTWADCVVLKEYFIHLTAVVIRSNNNNSLGIN